MGSLNNCQFIGRLGSDPEMRYLESGTAVAKFSIACDEKWKDKDGKQQERVEWVRVVAWGKLAEICAEYLAKGRQTYFAGRLSTREYEKDGQKKWSTEVVAASVVLLDGKGDGASRGGDSSAITEPDAATADVPF